MYKALEIISKHFSDRGIKYRTREVGDLGLVEAGFDGDYIKNLIIRYISRDNDNDVSVRTSEIARYPEDKRDLGLRRIAKLNDKYRFLKFVMDDEGDVSAQFDFPVETGDNCLGPMAREIFIRAINIIDESYREIMMEVLL